MAHPTVGAHCRQAQLTAVACGNQICDPTCRVISDFFRETKIVGRTEAKAVQVLCGKMSELVRLVTCLLLLHVS